MLVSIIAVAAGTDYTVVPGHYQHKHCHYCSNNHYSIPSVTYVYLFILDVE